MRPTLPAWLLLICLPCRASAQAPAPLRPALSFEDRSAVASGIQPGGSVAWLSVAREISEGSATIVRRQEVLADSDGDGTVRFELDREVPWKSIWVAVDLGTGEYALAAPEGFPLRQVARPGYGRPGRAEGRPDWLEDERPFLEYLVVRPQAGAWGMTAGDGGRDDEDGESNGRLVASLDRMRGLGSNAAPLERFRPGDVVIAIDPDRMEITANRLAAAPDQP